MVESLLDKRFLITETITNDWGIDGTVDQKEVINYVYDIQGRLSSKTSRVELLVPNYPYTPRGTSTSTWNYTYDPQGNLVNETYKSSSDNYSDGIVDSRSTTTKTYDANGNLTSDISETDANSDSIVDSRYITTKTYDANGNLTSDISETDTNGDGIVDSRSTATKTYDANGNLTSDISETDANGDGIVDSRSVKTNTYAYDASGNLTAEISERDENGNGIVDYRSATTKTYDASSNLTAEISERDENGNGIVDYRLVTTKTYDASSHLTAEISETDANGDSIVDYRSATTKTYDASGHLTAEISDKDWNNSGDHRRSTATMTYDTSGHLTTTTFERDDGANGQIEYRTVTTFTYDLNSQLTLEVTEIDSDGDATEKEVYHVTTAYTYDSSGNLTSKAFESNEPAFPYTPKVNHSLETYAYDSSSQLTKKISEIDVGSGWKTSHYHQITTSIYSTIFNEDSVPVPPPQIPAEMPIQLPVSPEENIGIVDSVLVDLSQVSGYVLTKFTLSRESPLDNFLGFYKVTDKNGGIDVDGDQLADLVPGDPGYTQAALNRYQPSIALTTGNGQTSVFVNELHGGSLYAPFLIAQGNPNSFSPDKVYFAFTAANTDGLEHIKFENGSLFCEDGTGGGDNDFNDAVISVQFLLDERPTLMNLTDVTGLAAVEFTLNREAAHDNFVGFYRVTDEHGGIDVDGDGVADLLPGDQGYTEAALASYETNVALVTADGKTSVFVNELAGGNFYAPFLVADGQPNDPSSFAIEEVYFAFTAANADGVEHIRFQDGSLHCEDWAGGGDNDFNDAVVQMRF